MRWLDGDSEMKFFSKEKGYDSYDRELRVICTSNKGWKPLPLTIGKMYEVINKSYLPFSPTRYDDASGLLYKIKCDTGEVRHFEADRFRELTIDEKRELKLEDLLYEK